MDAFSSPVKGKVAVTVAGLTDLMTGKSKFDYQCFGIDFLTILPIFSKYMQLFVGLPLFLSVARLCG